MALVRYAGTSPVAGIPLAVFNEGTQVATTIYADNLTPPTPQANPLTVDAVTGAYAFYAEEGTALDLTLSTGGDPPIT